MTKKNNKITLTMSVEEYKKQQETLLIAIELFCTPDIETYMKEREQLERYRLTKSRLLDLLRLWFS